MQTMANGVCIIDVKNVPGKMKKKKMKKTLKNVKKRGKNKKNV